MIGYFECDRHKDSTGNPLTLFFLSYDDQDICSECGCRGRLSWQVYPPKYPAKGAGLDKCKNSAEIFLPNTLYHET